MRQRHQLITHVNSVWPSLGRTAWAKLLCTEKWPLPNAFRVCGPWGVTSPPVTLIFFPMCLLAPNGASHSVHLRMSSSHVETSPSGAALMNTSLVITCFQKQTGALRRTVEALPKAAQAMPGLHGSEEDTAAPPQKEFFLALPHRFHRKQAQQIQKKQVDLEWGGGFIMEPSYHPPQIQREVTKARAFRGGN